MNVKFTARHFKAHDTLKDHAQSSIEGLTKYYDGILNAEVTLSFEKVANSVKIAEISLGVNGKTLEATGKSEEFEKSIDLAVEKIEAQLKKYKDKIRDVK
jgi:putative sigma-54 modulation protein